MDFGFLFGDELGTMSVEGDATSFCCRGLLESSLMWLHPNREFPCGICDCLGSISSDCLSSPNVLSNGLVAVMSVWNLSSAATINLAIPYLISPWQMLSAASPHPGCVILSSLICICSKLSMCCCIVLKILPITQLDLTSLLGLRSSVSS